MAPWTNLSEWWQTEVVADPAYEEVVTPLLLDVLQPVADTVYLDLGCGEGRIMAALAATGAIPIGIDATTELARSASRHGPTVVDSLPELNSIRTDSVDGALAVLVLEHLADTAAFFAGAARVVRPGGVLALVLNHPIWTAPGSTPITDEDGEVLWRTGDYFADRGTSEVRAGDGTLTFHHRTVSELANSAAAAGWALERMIELPHHELLDQPGIPRLMACRWHLVP